MNAVTVEYGALLSATRPEVITGEAQNQAYIQKLEELTSQETVSPAEEKLIALLTILVEEYETKHHPVPQAGPLDIIRHLMEAHRLRQKDLADVFGTHVEQLPSNTAQTTLGILLGGYSANESLSEGWTILIENGKPHPPTLLRAKADVGISWGGESES